MNPDNLRAYPVHVEIRGRILFKLAVFVVFRWPRALRRPKDRARVLAIQRVSTIASGCMECWGHGNLGQFLELSLTPVVDRELGNAWMQLYTYCDIAAE
jgi:hypothetical protein